MPTTAFIAQTLNHSSDYISAAREVAYYASASKLFMQQASYTGANMTQPSAPPPSLAASGDECAWLGLQDFIHTLSTGRARSNTVVGGSKFGPGSI